MPVILLAIKVANWYLAIFVLRSVSFKLFTTFTKLTINVRLMSF